MFNDVENIFLGENLRKSVHPSAAQKIMNDDNVLIMSTYFSDYLMVEFSFAMENSVYMIKMSYRSTECLNDIIGIWTHKENRLLLAVSSAEERSKATGILP